MRNGLTKGSGTRPQALRGRRDLVVKEDPRHPQAGGEVHPQGSRLALQFRFPGVNSANTFQASSDVKEILSRLDGLEQTIRADIRDTVTPKSQPRGKNSWYGHDQKLGKHSKLMGNIAPIGYAERT